MERLVDLPRPLVELIMERLHLLDYVRLGAVCREWYTIQKDHRRRHTPFCPPWLIYSATDTKETFCYSPFEQKFYNLQHSGAKGTRCIASSHGWLLLIEDRTILTCLRVIPKCNITLLNPLTKRRIRLPMQDLSCYCPITAAMSSSPKDPTCVIVIILSGKDIRLLKLGSSRWRWSRMLSPYNFFLEPVFCGGKFYCRSSGLNVLVIDPVADPEPTLELLHMDGIVSHRYHLRKLLVESDGELLLASVPWGVPLEEKIEEGFQVLKADFSKKVWKRAGSLGDRVLILSPSCAISLCADELASEGNKICFSSYDERNRSAWMEIVLGGWNVIEEPSRRAWMEIDLGSGSIIEEPSLCAAMKCDGLKENFIWFLPSLN